MFEIGGLPISPRRFRASLVVHWCIRTSLHDGQHVVPKPLRKHLPTRFFGMIFKGIVEQGSYGFVFRSAVD
jgi:hypothetical protein